MPGWVISGRGDGSIRLRRWDCIPSKCDLEGTWTSRRMDRESREGGRLTELQEKVEGTLTVYEWALIWL